MSDLAKAFAGLKEAGVRDQGPGASREPERPGTQVHKPQLVTAHTESTAKSRHPEYTPVKVFLRRETHRAAGRKWEDEDAGDFSDLVETLLQRYLDA